MIKMSRLVDQEREVVLLPRLEIASSFFRRLRGLMVSGLIAEDYGLFFPRCKSIHSCLMQTSFDLIFLNDGMVVTEVYEKVKPWQVISSSKGKHCMEIAPGNARKLNIKTGLKVKLVFEND